MDILSQKTEWNVKLLDSDHLNLMAEINVKDLILEMILWVLSWTN